ncbi:uncharacterized protein LOC116005173 [Ipomoea triloba]|uniref:uncharacterized protein LOC116005173 n=1 Tax=Ipomoea triloba TaxID=35885 RepID=UPI00125D9BD9|nr:uncharacterized protein LOC116005173 [Ipomoea triloba]
MASATLPSMLLIFFVAFTVATAHHSPSPSDKTRLVKACSEALGPSPGGRPLITFCARDFLAGKASLLAHSRKREAAAIVVNEARKKAKVIIDFKSKIDSDKSLSKGELKDLKSCWESMSVVIKTIGEVYVNVAVKKLSADVLGENIDNNITRAMGQCKFSAAERQGGLWAEFHAKADASFNAQVVALAFMNEYRSI